MFKTNADIYDYDTSISDSLVIPADNLTLYERSLIKSPKYFKSQITELLSRKTFYAVPDFLDS